MSFDPARVHADVLVGLTGGEHRSKIDAIRRGLPTSSLGLLIEVGRLTMDEAERVVLPRRVFRHRLKTGRLNPQESDRLARVVRMIAAAETTFGSVEKAAVWLRRPTTVLAGETPFALLDTDDGTRAVEGLLGRIDHGLAV